MSITCALIGQVDSGKSSLAGQLIYLCGGIREAAIAQIRREADLYALWRYPIEYAWVMDSIKESRERGISIDITTRHIKTDSDIDCALFDTPGHLSYRKNGFAGLSTADAAIIVVSAIELEYLSFHLNSAYAFGIRQLIVCVNKMDERTVDFSEDSFQSARLKISLLLLDAGFDPDTVVFIPISAVRGDNIRELSMRMPWWPQVAREDNEEASPLTLLQAIGRLQPPTSHRERMRNRPLHIPIQNVYVNSKWSEDEGGRCVVVGSIVSGVVKQGSILYVSVCRREKSRKEDEEVIVELLVESIQIQDQSVEQAGVGDHVGLRLHSTNFASRLLKRGAVLCGEFGHHHQSSFVSGKRWTEKFWAKVQVVNRTGKRNIRAGYAPELFVHTAHVPCRWQKLQSRISEIGEVLEEEPAELGVGEWGIVEMVPLRPLCVGSVEECPALGRIVVTDHRMVVAVGEVLGTQEAKNSGERTKGALKKVYS